MQSVHFIFFVAIRIFYSHSCEGGKGAYVINVNIHADAPVIAQLDMKYPEIFYADKESGSMRFFKGILDKVNQEIMPLGVQFQGNFKKFNMENYSPVYEKTQCKELQPHFTRYTTVIETIKLMMETIGTSIFVFYCPERSSFPPVGMIMTENECEESISIVYSQTSLTRDLIYSKLLQVASGRHPRFFPVKNDKSYAKALCDKVTKCTRKLNSQFKLVKDLKAVRHLSSESYIIKNHEKVPQHDLYDDLYITNHTGSHFKSEQSFNSPE